MDGFSILFVVFAAMTAAFSAHVAYRSLRDAANWLIDPATRELRCQNWTELGLAVLICLTGCAVVILAIAL